MTMIAYTPPSDLTGRLYLAAPLHTYDTARYRRLLAAVRLQFPRATLVEARGLFASNADWRVRWPAVLATLSGLVFLADEEGCIGAGVLREVMDAEAAGLRLWYGDDAGALHPRQAVTIAHNPDGDWTQFATVAVAAAVP